MEKYYNLKYKNNPDAYGRVVRIKEGKLKAILGNEDTLKEFRVSLDNKGNLKVGKNYFFKKISRSKAYDLKREVGNLALMIDWINEGPDTSASPHLFGPGRELIY